MGLALKDAKSKLPPTPWGYLPPKLRMLFITGRHRTGGWLTTALGCDNASEVVLEEAVGMARGLARLRDEVFDAVLISHEGEALNALEVLDAIRAGSSDEQPIVVLGEQSEQELAALCYEAGGDAYLCVGSTTVRTLIWEVARAVERHELIADNRRLQQAQRQRLEREHDEAARMLQQQRQMLADLQGPCAERTAAAAAVSQEATSSVLRADPDGGGPGSDLPPALAAHYRELLRAYVIMGAGNLSEEMNRLGESLARSATTPQQTMVLHLEVLEELVRGLGSRSARHVMNRADMLVLEVMINLAERYRERYVRSTLPPRQRLLPGFEPV